MWMVRAGRAGENAELFLQHGVVAIGYGIDEPLGAKMRKDELRKLLAAKYPDAKEASRESSASQIVRFLSEVKTGDPVVTFDRERRLYIVGQVVSDYEWAPALIADKPHVHRVKWTHQVARDSLAPATRNTLGSVLTLFWLHDDAVKDLNAHRAPLGAAPSVPQLSTTKTAAEPEEVEEEELLAEVLERADEFVEDAINRLSPYQMQDLMAGILRAMGYRTKVATPGPDRGVDIFASPDGLGLQEPRIFVEVKHRTGKQATPDMIRSFLGGRKPGDRCLYVSTGSFTKEARYEAERATVPITLIDVPLLRTLLLEHYEQLDAATRALVPLKRLYWPA